MSIEDRPVEARTPARRFSTGAALMGRYPRTRMRDSKPRLEAEDPG